MEYIRQDIYKPFTDGTFKVRGIDTYKLKSYRSKNEYVYIPCSFDIETTTIEETENAYMYIWQFGYIADGQQYVVKGRTWRQFDEFIRGISKRIGKKRLLVFVHNLPFEFMFLLGRYHSEMSEMFCKEKYKPLKFTLFGNIEFRDTFALTNSSLEKLAKDYTRTQKLKGDLDYTIKRNHMSILNEKEECYCDNDVIILCEYMQWVWDNLLEDEQIPLTATGILRNDVKKRAWQYYIDEYGMDLKQAKKSLANWIEYHAPSHALYDLMMNYCFKGGLTHANRHMCNITIDCGMDSDDYTSDYPAKMLQMERYYYPSKFKRVECADWQHLEQLMQKYCVMAIISFYDIEQTSIHSLISKSKCMEHEDFLADNGRLIKAKKIKVMETEVDLQGIYKHFYKWNEEKTEIHAVWVAERMELPKYLRDAIAVPYTQKAIKKEKKENYSNEKSKVNSGYGLTVQRLVEQEVGFDSETGEFINKQADGYTKQIRKNVLLPQWGVYVTAWGRYELAMAINSDKSNTCIAYYDTDSLKHTHSEKLEYYIHKYNSEIIEINRRMCEKEGYDFRIFHDLGCFDRETSEKNGGKYTRFKCLGAKRYLYEQNGELHQTVAGLPKNYIPSHFDNDSAFKEFSPNMKIEFSEKLRSVRNLLEHEEMVDGVRMHEYSSISLVEVSFKLKLEDYFLQMITNDAIKRERELNSYEKRKI